ncbi:tRNA glutamyl-Q(34) synthetase GluQRS [Aquisalimonas sp.]|uniref:tRNA glutamyl-Q(34) synthetase GluQRS n=1 Tax=Aquisalimonas sp. TaxID=1872621 RepID=UPI0025BD866B|nr:tRNA glutamyl-Q(34) synthetase GluQRS [Aquisalimonas sp.]
MTESRPYRGRFAPSPTGPLHFGSLVAAVGSYLDARHHYGEWLLRIDDIDPAREQAGAADGIRHTLDIFGFEPDGPVVYQSQRREAYDTAVEQLYWQGLAFPCGCTRKMVLRDGRPAMNGVIYPGTCRQGLPAGWEARTWRARAEGSVHIHDAFQGPVTVDLASDVGDFLIQRADGWPAYHLAAAVDDAASGITHVVRGHDLLLCTPPQVLVMEYLGATPPTYAHLPLALNAQGRKLSKQNLAQPLDDTAPARQLFAALKFLRQRPPAQLADADLDTLWHWALAHWDARPLRGMTAAPCGEDVPRE